VGITARDRYWLLESGSTAFALGLDETGVLIQTWYGSRLPRPEDYPAAQRGPIFAMEYTMQQTHQDLATGEAGASDERSIDAYSDSGLRGFVLRFESAAVDGDTLHLTLRDEAHNATVTLSYRVLEAFGLISRSVTVRNAGSATMHLTRLLSGTFYLPQSHEYVLNHLDGRWGDEFRMQKEPFIHGVIQRESRRMTTSHGGVPYFAVERRGPGLEAGEESGALWFGSLNWSGNWKLLAERTRDGRGIVHLGINDHDFVYDLRTGEELAAPDVFFGYTEGGFGAMSRAFHDFVREQHAPRRNYVPPVVYNSWYATLFDVTVEGQSAIADKAAAMGVELFVIDDGWFRKRNDDKAGLGDWTPDARKFPNGLKPLADLVHGKGMKFGVWIEPEMVNPDSDLYRAHEDWIIHFPSRERTLGRNQSMLNMGRVEVQNHLIATFDELLSGTPIDFIKWDMNRNVSEPGWPTHDRDQREIWVRYVQGLYRLWNELRRRHPNVIWENCSGGGGRVDLGMMAITDQSWASDNTLPPARLDIQEGYSQLFPANTMAAWVTDEHKDAFSLDLRFHVSMAGALGVGGNLLKWTDAEQEIGRKHVAMYKEIRPLVVGGDLYRLRSPRDGEVSALMYVAKDKSEAVLFAYRLLPSRPLRNPIIRLAGLDPDALYRLVDSERVLTGAGGSNPSGYPGTSTRAADAEGIALSGKAWAEIGLRLDLGDLESTIIRIQRA
jgi:alpha-galactosidase